MKSSFASLVLLSVSGCVWLAVSKCQGQLPPEKFRALETFDGKISFDPGSGFKRASRDQALRLLAEIKAKHNQNLKSIRTWAGHADSKYWQRSHEKDSPDGISHSSTEFFTDNPGNRQRYMRIFLLKKDNKLVRYGCHFKMQVGNLIHEYGPTVDNQMFEGKKVQTLLKIYHGRIRPGIKGGDFSAMEYFKFIGFPLEETIDSHIEDFEPKSYFVTEVSRKGPVIRIRFWSKSNPERFVTCYDVDLEKGANLTQFYQEDKDETAIFQCRLEQVGGSWVPKKYQHAHFRKNPEHVELDNYIRVEFQNRVNIELPKDTFEINIDDIDPNAMINDQRTNEMYRPAKRGQSN